VSLLLVAKCSNYLDPSTRIVYKTYQSCLYVHLKNADSEFCGEDVRNVVL